MAREYPLERTRNIGIMAHIDAGKTTTTERILYYTGRQLQDRRGPRGRRDHGLHGPGAGARDHHHVGRDQLLLGAGRGAATPASRHRINIIDTPGHVDFTIEVERSLRVLDGAVAVFDGGNGVEPQSETVWRQADKYHVPRIAFINKMDKVGADFLMCVNSIRERLGANAGRRSSIRVGEEDQHKGVVDLIKMKAAIFDEESKGQKYEWVEIPADIKATCAELARQDDRGVRRRRRRDHGEVPRRQAERGHRRR